MTPQEIRDGLKTLTAEIGPNTDASLSVSARTYGNPTVHATLWPDGICGKNSCVHAHAETFEGALAALRAKWAEVRADYEAATVREMALKIIEITADCGDCTDAALRQYFDASDIARLGAQAVEAADGMAANGPFRILATVGANAA